jgi:hypothetical protein
VNHATGSDTNNGTSSGTAFKTIQRALTQSTYYNLNGFQINIYVSDGTYNEQVFLPIINGSGSIYLHGNPTNPGSVKIISPLGSAIIGFNCGLYFINGFYLSAPVSNLPGDDGRGLWISGGPSSVRINNIEFGYCVDYHMVSDSGASIGLSSFTASPSTITISGSGSAHMATYGGTVLVGVEGLTDNPALRIANNVTFPVAFAYSTRNGFIGVAYTSITNYAYVTGTRWIVDQNSLIGEYGLGYSYFPGTANGAYSTGGVYVP